MKQRWLLITGILAISASWAFQASAQVGALTKLKLYRTYYTFELASPTAHQIEVYYQTPDEEGVPRWVSKNIGIQQDQDLTQLTEKDFLSISKFVAGWLQPPEEYEDIPEELEPKRAEIEIAFKRIVGREDLTNFIMVYSGYKALVNVEELVPISKTEPRAGEERLWVGVKSDRQYYVDLRKKELTPVGGMGTGYGLMFYDIKTPEQVQNIKWWDYKLPEAIEGSALFTMDYDQDGASELHKKAYKNLVQSVINTSEKAQNGISVNTSLEKILSRQGESILPPHFQQSLTYEVDIYGRVERGSDVEQLMSRVVFIIPFTDNAISIAKHDPDSDITLKLEGKFFGDDSGFTLVSTDPQGNTVSTELEIETTKWKITEVEGKKMTPYVPLKEPEDLQLPGRGIHTSFDIYLETDMSAFRLTGN